VVLSVAAAATLAANAALIAARPLPGRTVDLAVENERLRAKASSVAAIMSGGGASTPFRVCQEGVQFLVPYQSRQLLFASGAECALLLRYKGQQVLPGAGYGPRLAAALNLVDPGSVVVVCAPALDGYEASPDALPYLTDAAAPPPAPGVPPPSAALLAFYRTLLIDVAAKRIAARPTVAAADAYAMAPAFRVHYVTPDAAAADGVGADRLHLAPAVRVFPGSNPLARVVATLWRGRAKVGLMVHSDQIAELDGVITRAGYTASGATPSAAAPAAAAAAAVVPA